MPRLETRSIRLQCIANYNTIAPFNSQVTRPIGFDIITHTIYGSLPGPSLFVGGCMHGDELNGTAAALQLVEIIRSCELRGTVVVVPIQNPVAFNYRERLNPFDPIDPDWVFPGQKIGTYSQVLKYQLMLLANSAECVIDCHSAGRGGVNVPMVYCPPEIGNGGGDKSLELAKQFGGERIVVGDTEADYNWRVTFTLPFLAAREGRMGIYAEAGTGGSSIPDSKHVKYLVSGVLNVMVAMSMISGVFVEQGERVVVNPSRHEDHLVAPSEGIFLPMVGVGSSVLAAGCVAEVLCFSSVRHRLFALSSGMVTYLNNFGSVGAGDRLMTISPHS